MTGLCMWHGSFIRVTWLIDTIWHDSIMRDLNHSFVRHLRILGYTLQYCNNASQHHPQQPPISCRFVTWLFEMCDMTHADVTHSSLCHVDVLVREVGNSTVRVWVMSCLSCLRMSHVSQVHTNESRHTRAHERVTSRTCLGHVAHAHIQMSHTNANVTYKCITSPEYFWLKNWSIYGTHSNVRHDASMYDMAYLVFDYTLHAFCNPKVFTMQHAHQCWASLRHTVL